MRIQALEAKPFSQGNDPFVFTFVHRFRRTEKHDLVQVVVQSNVVSLGINGVDPNHDDPLYEIHMPNEDGPCPCRRLHHLPHLLVRLPVATHALHHLARPVPPDR